MERDFTNIWITLGLVVVIGGSISYWTLSQKPNTAETDAIAELAATEATATDTAQEEISGTQIATQTPQTAEQPATQPAQTTRPATVALKVYFGKEGDSPNATECSHSVARAVPYTSAVGRASLVELFKGPSENEIQQGYFSCFTRADITVRDLKIVNGTATVNLSKEFGEGCGSAASCLAQAQSAVTNTLKQFPTVKDVQIQVEGVPLITAGQSA